MVVVAEALEKLDVDDVADRDTVFICSEVWFR